MGQYMCPVCACKEMEETTDGRVERADCPDCGFGFVAMIRAGNSPLPFVRYKDLRLFDITPAGRAALHIDDVVDDK